VTTAAAAATGALSARAGCPDPDSLVRSTREQVDLSGKIAIVTGANTGLGKASVDQMLGMGIGTVVLAVRDVAKGEAAKTEILSQHPTASPSSLVVMEVDLADLDSVRRFASKCLNELDRIDILMNNAGVMATPQMTTKDGFEYQLGINHLGHFLLTNLLLEKIIATGQSSPSHPARIINVSSAAHLFGRINFDDLMLEDEEYGPWKAYGQSKLANVLFTRELADRLKAIAAPVTVNALHPGGVSTDLERYLLPKEEGLLRQTMIAIKDKVLLSPAQGAETQVFLATSPEVEGITGRYFSSCSEAETFASLDSRNKDQSKRLWDVSERIVGLK